MALWFPIMVNQFEVGRVELVRVAPVDHTPAEDEDCTYKLRYFDRTGYGRPAFETQVSHPYKSYNPIPLLSLALETTQTKVKV